MIKVVLGVMGIMRISGVFKKCGCNSVSVWWFWLVEEEYGFLLKSCKCGDSVVKLGLEWLVCRECGGCGSDEDGLWFGYGSDEDGLWFGYGSDKCELCKLKGDLIFGGGELRFEGLEFVGYESGILSFIGSSSDVSVEVIE